MITDAQYNSLLEKVKLLEARVDQLSKQYSALYMKNDIQKVLVTPNVPKNRKDTTKYLFDGDILCKRKLVLKCVKAYMELHSTYNGDEVRMIFPDHIQGSLGVIRRVEEAELYQDANKRFFFSDTDIIHCKDGDYVICSQWDKNNIRRFISVAKKTGLIIEEVKKA